MQQKWHYSLVGVHGLMVLFFWSYFACSEFHEDDLEENGNAIHITRAEFVMLLETPEAARMLRDVGVDVIGLIDYHDYLFREEAALDQNAPIS